MRTGETVLADKTAVLQMKISMHSCDDKTKVVFGPR